METLPAAYEDRVKELYSTLEAGIGRLLETARKRDVLAAPFGRPEPFSPYIHPGQTPDEGEAGEDTTEPEFSYDYGFNALSFLSGIIKQAHPDSVVARKNDRLVLFRELTRRAEFAKQQCRAASSLRADARLAAAGMASGPVTAPLSANSLLLTVRPRCLGQLVAQVSSSPQFTTDLQTLKEPVTDVSSTCKISINDLLPSKLYFIRCCVEDSSIEEANNAAAAAPDDDLDMRLDGDDGERPVAAPAADKDEEEDAPNCFLQGPIGGLFVESQCWTLPAELGEEVGESRAGGDDTHTTNSRPGSALSESRSAEANSAHSPKFSLFLAAGLDKALVEHFTKTSSGTEVPWPALQLGAAFDINGPLLAPPTSSNDLSGAWPPVVDDHSTANAAPETRSVFSCLLGDVFPYPGAAPRGLPRPSGQDVKDSVGEMPDQNADALYALLKNGKMFSDPRSVLCNTSILLAWNDGSVGADVALKNEESVYKQWAHNKRKHEKKLAAEKGGKGGSAARKTAAAGADLAPLQRPPLTPTLNALVENFPVLAEDAETRHLYKSVHLGPSVELLVLDTRRGYLGRNQCKWLKARLSDSTATWKIVLCGTAFGRIDIVSTIHQDASSSIPSKEATETDNQNSSRAEGANEDGSAAEHSPDVEVDDGAEEAKIRMSKSVSITRLDDLDEHGRFKDSIQALIYSLQKEPAPPPQEESVAPSATASAPGAGGASVASLSATPSAAGSILEASSLLEEPVVMDSRPWPERIGDSIHKNRREQLGGSHETFALTSGIILLTGNGSRTLEAKGSTAHTSVGAAECGIGSHDSQAAEAPPLHSCFVAIYNPKDIGDLPYCAEVNVCGHMPEAGQEAALDPSMGAFCVVPAAPQKPSVCARRRRDAVCALHSTAGGGLLVRLADAQTGDIMYEGTFVVPPPPPAARVSVGTPQTQRSGVAGTSR